MKALKKKTKIVLIAAACAVLLLVVAVVIFMPELIQPVLWTLLILGLGFFALEFWSRRKKRVRQKDFDEKVAAKEGIEDRKREWAGWIEELDRQGIDRYELPFYLIVGEPQSGKSVLLQNSDLYFPFGQNRLSGVGGTRGCDWWFTDEAVILDIAGRLFTHEGGVADKLEWEAFLDQLSEFRPLCPANGVLLVIPCDALLGDSPEVCADKANKIQSAMLTLTQKLQAQLPVYLVLTKGDRIFGFAESVHRLDGDQRHQMFGWSREAGLAEKPFALDEAREGFARLVERAELLREQMIASARLPEALPEIDRLYAFPDELEGMYKSLDIYLKRIFTESNLVDRASFRGIYLTSGLQTGAPVARVCADLLGGKGESDARALESLFSHQRAYFIKDLIRNRVFAERGLVRPTEGRVLAARRNAMIGYGAAAALALVAVVGSIVHLASGRASPVEEAINGALAAGQNAMQRAEIPDMQPAVITDLLGDLHGVDAAARIDQDLMHEVFRSTRAGFENLYGKVCDRALVPALRRGLETRIAKAAGEEPASFEAFQDLLESAIPLFAAIDFSSAEAQQLVKKWLSAESSTRVTDSQGAVVDFTVKDALARRKGGGSPTSAPNDHARLDPLAQRLLALLDRALDPATTWMPRGHFGYMLAWRGAREALKERKDAEVKLDPRLLQQCDVYANSVGTLKAIGQDKAIAEGVTNAGYMKERAELLRCWGLLRQWTRGGDADASWPPLDAIDSFAKQEFKQAKPGGAMPTLNPFTGPMARLVGKYQQDLLGRTLAKFDLHPAEVQVWITDQSGELEACESAPHRDWTIASLEKPLAETRKAANLYQAKVHVMAAQFPARFPDWTAAQADYHRGTAAPAANALDQASLAALASIKAQLGRYKLDESREPLAAKGGQHVAELIKEHLQAVDNAWASRTDWGTAVDWTIPTSLSRLVGDKGLGESVTSLADRLRWRYLDQHEARLLREWTGRGERADETLRICEALNEHLARLESLRTAYDPNQPMPLEDPEHQQWLDKVDDAVSSRLSRHVDALREYWRPKTDHWLDLKAALDGVKDALSRSTVLRVIADARKVDAPAANAPPLRTGQPIAATTQLPKLSKIVASSRVLNVPTESDITGHKTAKQLGTFVADLERQLAAGGGKELASTAVNMIRHRLAAVPPEGLPTVDLYLQSLFESLTAQVVARVRSDYVRSVAKAVASSDKRLLDAIYASDRKEIAAIDDRDILRRLGQLLEKEGQLDTLRSEYCMRAGKKDPQAPATPQDPQAPDLRPGDGFKPSPAEATWWQFERFLVGLQEFLAPGQKKVASAAFKVRFELPKPAGGVWDINQTDNKQFAYYATNSNDGGASGFVSYNKDWGPLEAPLAWRFEVSPRPQMWFLWTRTMRSSAFHWPQDKSASDISFDLTGSLAPLQLAWSGTEEAGWWEVQLDPEGAPKALKATLRLSFQDADGKDLVLPKRPVARPEPF